MEMLPPAPVPPASVVVGATIEKRFPGYGVHRGTVAEIDIDCGKVLVHWATDERTTLSLKEAVKRVVAIPSEDDDDQSVTSAAFGIESSATSFTAPRHVLLELDEEGDLQSVDGDTTAAYDSGDDTAPYEDEGGARATSSRFWGVCWDRKCKKWRASYKDADGKLRSVGRFDDEEEAARAVNKAIREAGLEGRRKTNLVDATGALMPKRVSVVGPDPARAPTEASSRFWGVSWHRKIKKWKAEYKDADHKTRHIGYFVTQEDAAHAVNAAIRRAGLEGKRRINAVDAAGALVPREYGCDRSAVVAPDLASDPTEASSKYWGVSWIKKNRRWHAGYRDADGKTRFIGLFDTQEAAARAYNAAIRRAGLEGKRRTNPVVDGQLVPRAYKARGHGVDALRGRKRRRDEPAATPSPRARRLRRAVDYAAMEDPDFEP